RTPTRHAAACCRAGTRNCLSRASRIPFSQPVRGDQSGHPLTRRAACWHRPDESSLAMTPILYPFLNLRAPLRPKKHRDLLILRLAQKLDDGPALAEYLALANAYSDGQIMTAYHRAASRNVSTNEVARFQAELQHTRPGASHNGKGYRLLALRIERRAVA